MILSAKSGIRGTLVDLDTGRPIPKVLWANLQTGEFEAYQVDANGDVVTLPDGSKKVYLARGRIKLIPRKSAKTVRPVDLCLVTGEPVDSGKTCNCLVCRRLAPVRRYRKIPVPLFSDYCDEPSCNRVALWMVSDEIALQPLVKDGRKFARGKNVETHYFCSFHFQPPRLLDHRGEVIREYDEIATRPC